MNLYKFLLFASIFILLLVSCKKWDLGQKNFPKVTTTHVNLGIDSTSATICLKIEGFLEDSEENFTTACGLIWATFSDSLRLENPNILGEGPLGQRTNGEHCHTIVSGLPLDTQIFYRAFMVFDGRVEYGGIESFYTGSLGEITLEVDSIRIYYASSMEVKADVEGHITGLPGGLLLNDFGIIWSQDIEPEYGINPGLSGLQATTVASERLSFNGTIDSLVVGKMLYVRPFLNFDGRIYLGEAKGKPVTDIWQPVLGFQGQPRKGAWAINLGDTVYVGQGEDPTLNNEYYQDVFAFSPADGQWKKSFDTDKKSKDVVSFVLNSEIYAGTGRFADSQTSLIADFWSFSASMGWTQEASFGGGKTEKAVSFVLDGNAYVGTGKVIGSIPVNSYRKTFYKFDASDWEPIADYPGPACIDAVAFTLNGTAYMGTGKAVDGTYLKDFYAYLPGTGTWDPTPISLPNEASGRAGAVTFVIGDKAYVGAGQNEEGLLQDFWCFNPANNSWSSIADIPGLPRTEAVGFSFEGNGYVGLGQGSLNTTLSDFWAYTPREE